MIITKPWVYESVDRVFEGSISYNDDIQTQKPGILISHAYGGCSEFEIRKAEGLAELGYVGFAIDLYGQGRRGSSPEESTALMIELDGDRGLLSKRINHSLSLLKEHKEVDSSKTAAVGFCFGGKCVLDLARSGADINGIISFHGIYDKPNIENKSPIKASILILHGFEERKKCRLANTCIWWCCSCIYQPTSN